MVAINNNCYHFQLFTFIFIHENKLLGWKFNLPYKTELKILHKNELYFINEH